MGKVGVITDTVACLPPDIAEQYGIGIVPIPLNINGKAYLDQVDITSEEFWKIFNDIKTFSTGAPAQGVFLEKFREMSRTCSDIVCTFVSKQLSAIHECAFQARDMYKQENPAVNIEILDSRMAAGAQAFIALEMAKASQSGKSLTDVIKVGEAAIPRAKFLCAMETLKYIIRSGRAPKTAYMGELFRVKPIIGMVNNTGLVENLGRVRGKAASIKIMIEMIKDYADCSKPLHIFAHYTNNIEDGNRIKALVTSQYKCDEVYMTPYSPVMSGHTGPVCAVAFFC